MIRIRFLVLFFSLSLTSSLSFSQAIKYRKYKEGEKFRYRLITEAYNYEQFASKTVSLSEHTVIKDSGYLSEQVVWLSKRLFTPKDTANLDSTALQVQPYKISLSRKGKVLLPKLTVPDMVGEITDLNTFYVAIAPALNAQKLSLKNNIFQNKEIRRGNFADSINILYGTDCIQVTQRLISSNRQYSIVETQFLPPTSACLEPLIDTIGKRIFDYPNNFQMIRAGANGKVNLFWGVEQFTISSKIDNKTGQIIEAEMINLLTLRMRYNATPDLKSYDAELPVTIRRVVRLELLHLIQ